MTDPAALPAHVRDNPRLSRWVSVAPDGAVELRVGKVELGQGILTALAQLAADELGVRPDQLRMLPARTGDGPDEGTTSGSLSLVQAGPAVRVVCADVRERFVRAAARRLRVDPSEVSVVDGRFLPPAGDGDTDGDGDILGYRELAPDVDLDVDASATALTGHEPTWVGRSVPRLDLPDKVAGRPAFIADLRLPGMLFGRVLRPPSRGARLLDVVGSDDLPDGVTVVRDGSFLGVVGSDEALVDRASDRLRAGCSWAERDTLPDEDDLPGFLLAGPHETTWLLDEADPAGGGRSLHARYSRPFLAHASMAPSGGIARWEPDGRLSVWSHSQGVYALRDAIAAALGLDPEAVTVEHAQNAGCYGHNGADDAAFDAVLLARAVPGSPVQVRWSREDELGWAPFGSAMVSDVSARIGDDGLIASWSYEVWSQGHTARPGYAGVPGLLAATHRHDAQQYPAAVDPPHARGGGTTRNAVPLYTLGARRIRSHRLLETPIRSSALRTLGAYFNVFAIESFVDELALLTDTDPLSLRLRHLGDPRAREVLGTAAREGGWGRPVEDGRGLGLGFARYKDTGAYCAVVAEVEATDRVRVHRLTLAVDVGRVVNPDGVRNQVEGGAVQSTSWTTKERVRFDRRRVTSTDWESYPVLSFSEAPAVTVHLVDRPELPSLGAGEVAQGPTAAAIANGVAAAVGVRVRDLPLTAEAVVAAIETQPD